MTTTRRNLLKAAVGSLSGVVGASIADESSMVEACESDERKVCTKPIPYPGFQEDDIEISEAWRTTVDHWWKQSVKFSGQEEMTFGDWCHCLGLSIDDIYSSEERGRRVHDSFRKAIKALREETQ